MGPYAAPQPGQELMSCPLRERNFRDLAAPKEKGRKTKCAKIHQSIWPFSPPESLRKAFHFLAEATLVGRSQQTQVYLIGKRG